MNIDYRNIGFWLGDWASLEAKLEADRQIQALASEGKDEEEEGFLRLLDVTDDGVAVITVKGSLTSRDSFWNRYFGLVSYTEIRNAVIYALENPAVKDIILDFDSNGGDAKGTSETAELVAKAKEHKPITSYISGTMYSAAYWIGAAATKVVGHKMSEAGSIGVIAIIPDYSQAYEKAGIKMHVFRGGKYKALGNGYEELTVAAQNIIQGKIDKMEGFFLEAVAEYRRIPRANVKEQVGEGLTFFAEEAVDNGLMDEIVNFDQLYSRLVAKYQSQQAGTMTLSEVDMGKRVLTEAAIAAKAAGASEEEVAALAEEAIGEETTEEEESTSSEEETSEEETSEDEPEDESEESEEGESEEAADPLTVYLKEQVAGLTKESAKLEAKNIELASKLEASQAGEIALREVAATFIAQMGIALGMSVPSTLASMDTANVMLHYTEVRKKFTETFKVGAAASVEDDTGEAAADGEPSGQHQAIVRANSGRRK